jgi:hypothetical protein
VKQSSKIGSGLLVAVLLAGSYTFSVLNPGGGGGTQQPVSDTNTPAVYVPRVSPTPTPTTSSTSGGSSPSTPGTRAFIFINNTSGTIWVGALNNPGFALPDHGGWAMAAGITTTLNLPTGWQGRFWGRTGCNFDSAGNGSCETGDCGRVLQCNGAGGVPPTTLAEFTLDAPSIGGTDIYDVSLVDGYNLPMTIHTSNATPANADPHTCAETGCMFDINATCPAELQVKNAGGKVIACNSACNAFNTDQYCCRGAYSTPQTCKAENWPVNYDKIFKKVCKDSYSYAYDDGTSTYGCKDCSYTITFGMGGTAKSPPGTPSTKGLS